MLELHRSPVRFFLDKLDKQIFPCKVGAKIEPKMIICKEQKMIIAL